MGEHDRADFDRPDPTFAVERDRQGLPGKLGRWDVWQQAASIQVYRMAAGRFYNRDLKFQQAPGEVGSLPQTVSKVIFVQAFP